MKHTKSLISSLLLFSSMLVQAELPRQTTEIKNLSAATQNMIEGIKDADIVAIEDAIVEGADLNARFGKNGETPVLYAMRMVQEHPNRFTAEKVGLGII